MSVSVLSVSAIFVSFGTLLLVFGLDWRSRSIAEERFSDLSRHTMLLHHNHSARVLDAVICWLYPKPRPGIVFVIDCEAHGKRAYIKEWRLTSRKPTQAEIDQAIKALSAELK